MQVLPQWEFDIYALSLPRGHGFGDRPPVEVAEIDGRQRALPMAATPICDG
jgi:hypothetical protein